jgi:deoxyribonuclease-4
MSVAGGLTRAVERAVAHRCDALQIFTKNASQWVGRPLGADDIAAFRAAVDSAGIAPVVSHASYLINLASHDTGLRDKSIRALRDELERAEALGLLGVVLHPGAHTASTIEAGLERIAGALRQLLVEHAGRTMVLLEHTAGQGSTLGSTFEQLASILAGVDGHARVGVCLDTCHLLAAGYDIASADGYEATFGQFDSLIGLGRLRVVHANDSKKPLGSRVDRHTHIGEGFVGVDGFRRLVRDVRFRGLPMLLETPKGKDAGKVPIQLDEFDLRNLSLLRSLAEPPASPSS